MVNSTDSGDGKKKAFQLIILFGLVSLFGDIIYEGARSVNGPYLKTMGVNAAIVGIIGGLGEFLGYAIRLVSGYFADRTKAYWLFTFVGYGLLISVPLLSLAGIWQVAALFIVTERLGKALRSPAKDTILSQAAKQVGTGWGFGLNEAMDQLGALLGPLIFTGLFLATGGGVKAIRDYQVGYAILWVPFILLIVAIIVAYLRVPDPGTLEVPSDQPEPDKLSRVFWLYTIFSFLTAVGFVSFILMGYHFKAKGMLSDAEIPFFYAIAMAVDGVAALIIGKLYDVLKAQINNAKAGLLLLGGIPLLSAMIPVLAFSTQKSLVVASVVIWGVVMGAHETIMKSAIADLTPMRKRGTGYGIFNTAYGVAMFIGAASMGFLYDISIPLMVLLASAVQFLSLPVFFMMKREAGLSGK
jgi:MFS family permease